MQSEKTLSQKTLLVDLDAVARAMGWDQRIQLAVEQATEDLNGQLLKAAQEMDADLKKQQAELGGNPTPDQQARLRQLKLLVDQKIQSNKVIAQNARDRVRNEQILLFRNEVKPISGRVAKKHGAEVVLRTNDEVIWYDAAVDITGEIISEMRSQSHSVSGAASGTSSEVNETNRPPQPAATADQPAGTAGEEAPSQTVPEVDQP